MNETKSSSDEEEPPMGKNGESNWRQYWWEGVDDFNKFLIHQKQFVNAGGYCRLCKHFYPEFPDHLDVPDSIGTAHNDAIYEKAQYKHLWDCHRMQLIETSTRFRDLTALFVNETKCSLMTERIAGLL